MLLVRRDLNVATGVGNILLEAQELEFVPCSDFFPEVFKAFNTKRARSLASPTRRSRPWLSSEPRGSS